MIIQKSDGKVKLEYETEAKDKEGKQIFVEADRERITQVVWNLLTNAMKFTKDGTISISVTFIIKRWEVIDDMKGYR